MPIPVLLSTTYAFWASVAVAGVLGGTLIGDAPETGTLTDIPVPGGVLTGAPQSASRADPALRGCPKRQSWRGPLGDTTLPPGGYDQINALTKTKNSVSRLGTAGMSKNREGRTGPFP